LIHPNFVLVIISPSDLGLSTSFVTVKQPLSCPFRTFGLASASFSSSVLDKYRYLSSKNFQYRKLQVVYGSGSIHVKPLCPICHSRSFKSKFFWCVIAFSDFTNLFAAKQHGCPLQSNTFGSLMINQGCCRGFITKSIRFYRHLPSDFYRNFVHPLIPHGFFASYFPAVCLPRHGKHSLCMRHLVVTSLRLNFSQFWILCSPLRQIPHCLLFSFEKGRETLLV
jgi:hypothetical protein